MKNTTERILDILEGYGDESLGLCMACGAEALNVEPDAEGYKCEDCGKRAVVGAHWLLFRLEAM